MRSLALTLFALCGLVQGEVHKISGINAKDLEYSVQSGLLYASIGSNSPAFANTVAIIDPVNGAVVDSISVGLDPGKMALSDDGRILFVSLDAESKMQRIRLQEKAVEPPFRIDYQPTVGSNPTSRLTVAVKVIHGTDNTVIVSQVGNVGISHLGLAVYRDGVLLPNITPPSTRCDNITLTDSADKLWCYDNESTGFGLQKLLVDVSGVATEGAPISGLACCFGGELRFHNGLLYSGSGSPIWALDPETHRKVGAFDVFPGDYALDGDNGVIYAMWKSGIDLSLVKFDLTKFVALAEFSTAGHIEIPRPGDPRRLTLCRSQGILAMLSDTGSVYFYETSLLTPLPFPMPVVEDGDAGIRALQLPASAIAYDPNSDRIYAAAWSGTAGGNTISAIDPVTLTVEASLWVGSDPYYVAISADGHYLFQTLLGATYVQRVDLRSWERDLQIPLFSKTADPIRATSVVALSQNPESFAVSLSYAPIGPDIEPESTVVFDGANRRPVVAPGYRVLQLDSSGTNLFGLRGTYLPNIFSTLTISPDGVRSDDNLSFSLPGASSDIKCVDDICFDDIGNVFEGKTKKMIGVCPLSGAVLPDLGGRRVYYAAGSLIGGFSVTITSCSLDTFYPAESVTIRGISSAASLLLWRVDQLAFTTGDMIVTVPKTALKPVTSMPPVLRIESIDPNPVIGANAAQKIIIHGSGFQYGSDLKVRLANGTYHVDLTGDQVAFISSSELKIAANLGIARSSNWTIQVINPTGLRSDPFSFSVISPIPASSTAILPQFAFGGGWSTYIYISNTTDIATTIEVAFIGDTGLPLMVPLAGEVGTSSKVFELQPHATTVLEVPNVGPLSQGWVQAVLPAGVIGYGVFRQTVPGRADQEAVVPLSPGDQVAQFVYDDKAFTTAIALVNPTSELLSIRIVNYDGSTGSAIGSAAVNVPARSKITVPARNLQGLSSVAGRRGLLSFSISGGSLAILGLRFGGQAFTSIPVTYGLAKFFSQTFAVPQLVFGGGWYTAFYFANMTGESNDLKLDYYGSDGGPLNVPLLGRDPASEQSFRLSPASTVVVEAPNTGGLIQGSVHVEASVDIAGYAVFRQSVPGRTDQEAIVTLTSELAQSASLVFDDASMVTAFTILNPTNQEIRTTVTAFGDEGAQIGNATFTIPAKSTRAQRLRDVPGLEAIDGSRGLAVFTAPNPAISVLGLRFGAEAFTSIPVDHR